MGLCARLLLWMNLQDKGLEECIVSYFLRQECLHRSDSLFMKKISVLLYWTKKVPAWFETKKENLDASGLYASGSLSDSMKLNQ